MKELEIRELIKKEVKIAVEYEMKDIHNLRIEDCKTLLKNYSKLKRRIEKFKFDVNYINSPEYVPISFKEEGVCVQGTKEYKSELEKKEEKLEELNKKIENYSNIVNKIEIILNILRDDDYYMIIELKYFNKMSVESILETMSISYGSYKRHHHKLLKDFRSYMNF